MSASPTHNEPLLDRIIATAIAMQGEPGACELQAWVRQYFETASPDALAARSVEQLARTALNHLQLGRRRGARQVLIQVRPPPPGQLLASLQTCVDDMPFLVDTLVMAVRDAGAAIDWSVHPVCRVQRDAQGGLTQQLLGEQAESWIHLEFEALTDRDAYAALERAVADRIDDLRRVVADYAPMRERLLAAAESLEQAPPVAGADPSEQREAAAFLRWLDQGHFTLLASAQTRMEPAADGRPRFVPVAGSGLGLAREGACFADIDALIAPREQLDKYAESPRIVVLTKAAQRATVHHPEYMDHVAVRRLGADGGVDGIVRLIGLFSSEAYVERPWDIPLIRRKVETVMQRSRLQPGSHSAKNLREILHSLPRDELFQSGENELFDTCMGIRALRDRHPLRLFLRRDRYGRFFSALVYLPRERYSRELRDRLSQELLNVCGGVSVDRTVDFLRGGLTRLHVTVRTPPGQELSESAAQIERRLMALARPWREQLLDALRAMSAPDAESLALRFGEAFAPSYIERVAPVEAAADVCALAQLSDTKRVLPSLQAQAAVGEHGRLKLYAWRQPLALADVLPLLEHFGLRAIRQDPEVVSPREPAGSEPVALWIQDFEVGLPQPVRLDRAAEFEASLLAVMAGAAEDDALNRLVLAAGLDGRQVGCLRMLARYVNQIGMPFGRADIEQRVAQHPAVAAAVVQRFEARFDPALADAERVALEAGAQAELDAALDAVEDLDADRILRALAAVVRAGLRTNFYCRDELGAPLSRLSLKLDPRQIGELPQPRPMFEIWVYAPGFEGVHLRGGRVARGGLRWSDRREDFRTEVLGLMKAQQVKNAVIVPVGAKGGFVVKGGPPATDREAWMAHGVSCYREFLRGLLDLTDNRVGDGIAAPPGVVRHDDDDPYLVVAADKGTATFSDIANGVAEDYGFWLGDAFASGGSAGYDHKKMGITARGAWESVKRHFRELGLDVDSDAFSAVGVGDMSGDVFGNGMLLSRQIRLIAAFDHRHIFIDPNPDPAASYDERARLFALPRSSWADYDAARLSPGGGVYPRNAKRIALSAQARRALALEQDSLTPAELIRGVLQAPVDLFWNGGIGTYVKATHESNEQARDRANDAVRIDGRELRVRVVGEGGNLGLTQAGRIEYATRGAGGTGGRINTDAVDNSGGVHSSDREVNIKIPLNQAMRERGLTRADRDELLASMTTAVSSAVLRDNAVQSACISLVESEAAARLDDHAALIRRFEREGVLNRVLEGLPDDEELQKRRTEGRGLLRPEIAVLMAYSKNALFDAATVPELADDPHFLSDLLHYFPSPLVQAQRAAIEQHRLRREIVATVCANDVVNRMGVSFVHRLAEDQGLSLTQVLRAYALAGTLFDAPRYWREIEAMESRLSSELVYRLMLQAVALLRHVAAAVASARMLDGAAIGMIAARYEGVVGELEAQLPDILPPAYREDYDRHLAGLRDRGVPAALAGLLTRSRALGSALDIADLAREAALDRREVAPIYFAVGEVLRLPWMLAAIIGLRPATAWQALARSRLREDAYRLHRAICARVLAAGDQPPSQRLEAWTAQRGPRLALSLARLSELQSAAAVDYAGLAVAVRELHDLQAL
ncbi:NAD-glutamate dehydrogenase [Panacagrimonas sp.]|uniref:NAD-glutamate dehydrogenase n=1 Tax=Panacagrimonas sp. TaxID=2480088 RepID=UPI003B5282FD